MVRRAAGVAPFHRRWKAAQVRPDQHRRRGRRVMTLERRPGDRVGRVERHDDQRRERAEPRARGEVEIDAVANPPVRQVDRAGRRVVDLDELQVATARSVARVVVQFADDDRPDARPAVGSSERRRPHRVQVAVGVGPAAERLAVGRRRERHVIDESRQLAAASASSATRRRRGHCPARNRSGHAGGRVEIVLVVDQIAAGRKGSAVGMRYFSSCRWSR